MKKICKLCGIEKDLDQFKKDHRLKSGYGAICKRCDCKLAKKWREENPEKKKSQHLLNKYNIDWDYYNHLLESQDGRCSICGTKDPKGRGNFHVDHCHETGRIRGLLCNECNIGLGKFKDDPTILHQAADYLMRFNAGLG